MSIWKIMTIGIKVSVVDSILYFLIYILINWKDLQNKKAKTSTLNFIWWVAWLDSEKSSLLWAEQLEISQQRSLQGCFHQRELKQVHWAGDWTGLVQSQWTVGGMPRIETSFFREKVIKVIPKRDVPVTDFLYSSTAEIKDYSFSLED